MFMYVYDDIVVSFYVHNFILYGHIKVTSINSPTRSQIYTRILPTSIYIKGQMYY